MRRILLLTSFILLSLSLFSTPVKIKGIYYTLDDVAKTAEVTYTQKKNVYSGDITIPDSIEYGGTIYCVTSIGQHAFRDCSELKSVTIPSTIQFIGSVAFADCPKLTAFHISDLKKWCTIERESGITAIDGTTREYGNLHLYLNGEEIVNLVIPSDVKTIKKWAFQSFTFIISVDISEGVENIEYWAFDGCKGLNRISLPNSLKTIEAAFSDCTGLTYIDIPKGLTSISNAFSGCTGLTSIDIPSNITCIDGAFSGCTGLLEIKIPDSVISIEGAFSGCRSLTSVTIPSSVTSTGWYTFSGCTDLTKVILPDNLTSIGAYSFKDCLSLESINIPSDILYIEHNAFMGCSALKSVVVPNGINKIETSLFEGCSGLESIKIPDSVTEIQVNAFADCSLLNSITLGKELSSIQIAAFKGCENLKEMHFYSKIVPQANNIFYGNGYENNITLFVLDNLVNEYKRTDPWRYFKEIKGISEATGIRNITSPKNNYVIFNTRGNHYNTLQKGLNIIKEDGKTRKILIK